MAKGMGFTPPEYNPLKQEHFDRASKKTKETMAEAEKARREAEKVVVVEGEPGEKITLTVEKINDLGMKIKEILNSEKEGNWDEDHDGTMQEFPPNYEELLEKIIDKMKETFDASKKESEAD